jgi:hypothetical protein
MSVVRTAYPAVLMLALWGAACGGADSSPPAPTSAAVPALLTIQPSLGTLWTGESRSLTAFVVYSDGNGNSVDAVWTSSSHTRASVSASGQLLGLASGDVVVTASAVGLTGTLAVRVRPSWSGVWRTRTAMVLACEPSTLWVCAPSLVVNLSLSQMSDDVSGVLTVANAVCPVSGKISPEGTLKLTGSAIAGTLTNFGITVESWETKIDSQGRMSGRATVWLAGSSAGRVTLDLSTLTKSP